MNFAFKHQNRFLKLLLEQIAHSVLVIKSYGLNQGHVKT